MNDAILDLVHENPESIILLHQINPKKIIKVDVGKHENILDVEKGDNISDLTINGDEQRKKRREDMKLHLTHNGVTDINQVYTISKVDG